MCIRDRFRDYGATTPYDKEECAQYLKNNDTYIHFQGEYIPRDKFLGTWETIVCYATTKMTSLVNTTKRSNEPSRVGTDERDRPEETPPEIHITQEGKRGTTVRK